MASVIRSASLVVALVALALEIAPIATAASGAEKIEGLEGLGDDPKELEAYDLLQKGRLIESRIRAEALLRERPDSYAGRYVLGYVLHHAEANLPLAVHHLERARVLYE